MSRLTDLLRQVEQRDPALAADLAEEVRALSGRRAFGLNFERHVPESVELPGRPIRKGDKARVLPERGTAPTRADQAVWRVASVSGSGDARVATLVRQSDPDSEVQAITKPVTELVVVAEFRDPIYPGLRSTGKVERGGDKPFHTVLNAENFHALQALLFTHEGKIDAIYIDPPYNTGARDWKYNNDYVDADDSYRHSKWLAFMERRLKLARRLLNPHDSVLIVSIDEKEVHRLGLLVEQTFPEAKVQMVSIAINPAAVARGREFRRGDEYYYFVMVGAAGPDAVPLAGDWITAKGRTHRGEIRWDLLRRSAQASARSDRPGMFYPFFVDPTTSRIHSIGDSIPLGQARDTVTPPEGTVAVWPLRRNGIEGRWRLGPDTAREAHARGFVKVGAIKGETTPIYYLTEGEQRKVADGIYSVTGRAADGSVITSTLDSVERRIVPSTQWRVASHDSTQYGSRLLQGFVPSRRFPFPKSMYAVEDALRFFVHDKRDACVVDFFAGSGTTAHAVMRLNRLDDGWRQCISVTNNEVSADEQGGLIRQGHRPGDDEWEALGICEYITKPRLCAAVTGNRPDGETVKGQYKFVDEFPMSSGFEENVEFLTMTYEAPLAVAHNRAFKAIAPLLWLRAGAEGRRIESATHGFDVADTYGVLFDLDSSKEFLEAVHKAASLRFAFVVTDDERAFQMVCSEMPHHVEPVRLYESYLTNFTINTGRE